MENNSLLELRDNEITHLKRTLAACRESLAETQRVLAELVVSTNTSNKTLFGVATIRHDLLEARIDAVEKAMPVVGVHVLKTVSPERARQIGEQVSVAAEQAAWETLEASRRLDAQALERAKQR